MEVDKIDLINLLYTITNAKDHLTRAEELAKLMLDMVVGVEVAVQVRDTNHKLVGHLAIDREKANSLGSKDQEVMPSFSEMELAAEIYDRAARATNTVGQMRLHQDFIQVSRFLHKTRAGGSDDERR